MKNSLSQTPDLLPCFAKLEAGAFRLQIALAFAVDSGGRLPAEPSFLKNYLFPLSTEAITLQSIQDDLSALVKCGNVILFEEGGMKYLVLLCLEQIRGGKRPIYPSPSGRTSKWIPSEDDYAIHKAQITSSQNEPIPASSKESTSDDSVVVPFNLPYPPDHADKSPESAPTAPLSRNNPETPQESTNTKSDNQLSSSPSPIIRDGIEHISPSLQISEVPHHSKECPQALDDRKPTEQELQLLTPPILDIQAHGRKIGSTPFWTQTWFLHNKRSLWNRFSLKSLNLWREIMKSDFDHFTRTGKFVVNQTPI